MAEAREKFLTRQEQIDYAAAKTGSAKYSALGALMPVTFGGPLHWWRSSIRCGHVFR